MEHDTDVQEWTEDAATCPTLQRRQARLALGWHGVARCWLVGPRTVADVQAMAALDLVPVLERWLRWWHGRGMAEQDPYFRCHGCRRIVTWKAIAQGGCTCKLSNKLSPAALRWDERVRLLVLPFWCVR